MQILKQTIGLLLLAVIIIVVGQFMPGVNVLFDNYLVGFVLTMIVILIVRMMVKSHMAKVAMLPQGSRAKMEKESKEQWEETCEATFSLSQPLDLRNMTNDD